MPFKPPKPPALRPRVIGCSVPRDLANRMEQIATTKGITISQVMRAAIVQVYDPERRDPPDD